MDDFPVFSRIIPRKSIRLSRRILPRLAGAEEACANFGDLCSLRSLFTGSLRPDGISSDATVSLSRTNLRHPGLIHGSAVFRIVTSSCRDTNAARRLK
jgi:hypothetical protein